MTTAKEIIEKHKQKARLAQEPIAEYVYVDAMEEYALLKVEENVGMGTVINQPANYKPFAEFIDFKYLGIFTQHQMQVFKEASAKFLAQFNQPAELIPFDLAKALAGEKVITRDGRQVIELTHFKSSSVNYPLYGVINGAVHKWTILGQWQDGIGEVETDLFMAPPQTVTKWVNVYDDKSCGGTLYNSEESANKYQPSSSIGSFPITIPVK